MKKLVVAGTGQLSVLQIIAKQPEYEFLGFLDDKKENQINRNLHGYNIIGGFDWLAEQEEEDVFVVNSIARSTLIRAKATQRLESFNASFANLYNHELDLSMSVIGVGNIIGNNVNIEPNVSIGNHNIILSGTNIGHDVKIGDNNFIGVSSILQGHVKVCNNVFLSAGTIVEPEIVINDRSVTMSGAIVFENVISDSMVITKPSRQIPISQNSRHYFANY